MLLDSISLSFSSFCSKNVSKEILRGKNHDAREREREREEEEERERGLVSSI